MVTLKKYNLEGQQTGEVQANAAIAEAQANGQMVKDYIVALRANARQWSASTKTRAEVKHTTKKPHPQKGGGRARQGSTVSPQYRGGGRVGAPRPKFDQHVRINKKERRAAIRFLIAEKMQGSKLHVLENHQMEAPKTKHLANFLNALNLRKKTLFLGEGLYAEFDAGEKGTVQISVSSDKHEHFVKSLRNIPNANFSLVRNASGYDVIRAHDIVVTEAALEELVQWLG